MNNILIGRGSEIKQLTAYANSGRPEFIAIYGRRRVGKTFLVNHLFRDKFTFAMTGVLEGDKSAQMHAFVDALEMYGNPSEPIPINWFKAFQVLRRFLARRLDSQRRCIVFIDELPCLDTRQSDFAKALGYFWNSWASLQSQMMLIVCGSSTSWMMKNIINSHGGLHDRITHELHLKEFTLSETEEYLRAQGSVWDRLTIAQTYMMCGGIPYYLSLLNPALSLAQNIDELFFAHNGTMLHEFNRLYKTLFSTPNPYVAVVEQLASKRVGLTRNEIAASLGKSSSGQLSTVLQNLIDCDLVRFYRVRNKKISRQGGLYQLMDFFSIFYLTFVRNRSGDEHFWTKSIGRPSVNSWMGLAFERLCLKHINQVKRALRIDSILTEQYSWRSTSEIERAQVDMIIERADRMINLCEIKYSENTYRLDKEEYQKLSGRIALFKQQTGYKGGIIPTFITTNGLANNAYAQHISASITLDDLFE